MKSSQDKAFERTSAQVGLADAVNDHSLPKALQKAVREWDAAFRDTTTVLNECYELHILNPADVERHANRQDLEAHAWLERFKSGRCSEEDAMLRIHEAAVTAQGRCDALRLVISATRQRRRTTSRKRV